MAKRKLVDEEWFDDITALPDDAWDGCVRELKPFLPKGRVKPVGREGMVNSKWDTILNAKREVVPAPQLLTGDREDDEALAVVRTHVVRAERVYDLYRAHGYEQTLLSTPNPRDVEISLLYALLAEDIPDERAFDLLGRLAMAGEIDELVPYRMLLGEYVALMDDEDDARGFVDLARRICRLAEAEYPDIYVDARASLGLFLLDEDLSDDGEEMLADLLRRFPDSVAAMVAYAQFLTGEEREAEAAKLLKEALDEAGSQGEVDAVGAIGQRLLLMGEMTQDEVDSAVADADSSVQMLEAIRDGERDFIMEAVEDHPEYAEHLEHAPDDELDGVNPGAHLAAHAFVEHLLADGGFPELNQALVRLTAAGSDRHDAIHHLMAPLKDVLDKGPDAEVPAEWGAMIMRLADRVM